MCSCCFLHVNISVSAYSLPKMTQNPQLFCETWDVTFSFQAILSGTQWFSCETTGKSDCIALHQRSSVCVVVLSNEACLPSSRVSAIQTPAPRWQPQSSGSFSVLLTRHLKRPVLFTALPFFSHIYLAENGMNLFFAASSAVPRYWLHQAHAGWSCLPSQ